MPAECKVCLSERQPDIEALGLMAVEGSISWAEVARRLNWTHAKGVQNHMERHYVAPATPIEEADSVTDELVAQTMVELQDQMRIAPVEVKPFYAIAIQNLKGLKNTKPSQQHLINALKAVHEVTGMRMEQRLMLDFAKAHFNSVGPAAKAAVEERTGVIDIDVEETADA